uniref:neuronal PAS domain-containing protein 4-like n=1 Tax=Gasterosteus aculeatus aculeatus TaxID=481459 RepID=UPI001A992A25|nr:neuronal PAS domain-containing protein 4-like [Gasterosteus aculeatus aculeatus]
MRDGQTGWTLFIRTRPRRGVIMTIWCTACQCDVSAPCTSHLVPEHQRSSFCRRFRSTKGASKARRDHINHEIRNMRALLPTTLEDQERLSYLHSMAAICAYIRKSVVFQGLPTGARSHSPPYEAFLQALHGFILVTTAQGRLVYVSENVDQYLGLSMIDVLQGDTFYDMVERSDIDVVKTHLEIEHNSPSERSFICRMQTSKAFKLRHGSCCSMMVKGSFKRFPQPWQPSSSARPTSQPLFVALCTPTVDRLQSSDSPSCDSFHSVHGLDMTFTQLSDSASCFLGYSTEEMAGRSWYSLVHPDDLSLSADSHRSLMRADEGFQAEMVLRLQCKDLSWTWIYIRAYKESDCQSISCTNFIISETEARFLQKKITSDAFRPSPTPHFASQEVPHAETYGDPKCFKRRRTSSGQSEEPGHKARRASEQDFCHVASASSRGDGSPAPPGDSAALFTPPYSPASSSSTLQQEELSRDLLLDVHGYSDQLLSSPECSPSYYSYPEAVLTCHRSPSGSLAQAAEQTFEQAAFGVFAARSPASSSSSSSPAYDFQACTADARLVPDCPSVSDLCDGAADCALHHDGFSVLQQTQEGGLVQVHHVPYHVLPAHSGLLTPGQSPNSSETAHYNEREQAEISILAQQISSLASSFAMYRTHDALPPATTNAQPSGREWPCHPPIPSALPLKGELDLDDCVFDSILKDLDVGARKDCFSRPGVAAFGDQQGLLRCRIGSHESEPEPEPLCLSPTTTEDPLSAEQFIAMGPFGLQLGRHDRNTGLHQLNRYMQSPLQQDELAEENLY